MSITLWKHKGVALTHEEIDGNFEDLSQRVALLEGLDSFADPINKIILEGDELVFFTRTDAILGRVRLPIPQAHFKGPWKEGKAYTYGDIVRHKCALYFCHAAHEGSTTVQSASWMLMFGSEQEDETPSTIEPSQREGLQIPLCDASHMPDPKLGALIVALGPDGASLMLGTETGWQKVVNFSV